MRHLLFLCIILPLVACSSRGSLPRVSLPPVQPAPYQITLDFSSSVPDDYPVLSGPAETYQRIQVNRAFRALLEEYVAAKTSPGADTRVTFRIALEDLKTGYESLGGAYSGFALGAGFGFVDDEPGNIPMVIIKSGRMKTRFVISGSGKTLLQQEIEVEEREKIERPWYDSWTYDYTGLVEKLMKGTILRINGWVDRTLKEGD